jgi:hypothetical protein
VLSFRLYSWQLDDEERQQLNSEELQHLYSSAGIDCYGNQVKNDATRTRSKHGRNKKYTTISLTNLNTNWETWEDNTMIL